MDKKVFVEMFLERTLKAINNSVKSVHYMKTEINEEFVVVKFSNGYQKTICVTADSNGAIAIDVIKEIM